MASFPPHSQQSTDKLSLYLLQPIDNSEPLPGTHASTYLRTCGQAALRTTPLGLHIGVLVDDIRASDRVSLVRTACRGIVAAKAAAEFEEGREEERDLR